MDEFEHLAAELAKRGFHASMHRGATEWQCTLFNSVLLGRPPSGAGRSAIDALCEAHAETVQRLKK